MTPDIPYQPDETPPLPLTLALGLQYALLAVTSIIIVPSIMIRLGGQGEAYLAWAVFAALVISSLTTLIQVVRIGRFGAGYILLMGSTSTFLVVCVPALEQGGPSLLAPLIVVSPDEAEFSLRLLRHHATSVRHQQFHDTDVLLVRVEPQAEVAEEPA